LTGMFSKRWMCSAVAAAGLVVAALLGGARADVGVPPDPVPVVQQIDIDVVDDYPDGFDWAGFARAVIGVAPGDAFSEEAMERAVTSLSIFSEVQPSLQKGANGVSLVFVLTPYKRIKSIAFNGLFPLFEKDVNAAMTITVGDLFNSVLVAEQAQLIARRYRSEGYIRPEVTLSWRQSRQDGHFHIDVDIEKGAYYVLKDVELRGTRSFSDQELKGMMRSWRRAVAFLGQGRFMEDQLDKDVADLVAFYRSRGYADVAIDRELQRDPESGHVHVVLSVHEGPLYSVTFSGNRFFSADDLTGEVVLFKKGNRGNTGIRRSVQNIRRRYLQSGFADVRVRSKEGVPGGTTDERTYEITVEEGSRYIVDKIDFQGHRAVSTDELRGQMLTRPAGTFNSGAYVKSLLQEDLTAILSLYRQIGFLETRIADALSVDPQTKRVHLSLTIEEGVQTTVGSISLDHHGTLALEQWSDRLQVKSGAPFNPLVVARGENTLAALIAPQGYPHVRVEGRTELSEDRTRADIIYAVEPGPRVSLGSVFLFGNFRTREAILRREISLKPGEPFSLVDVVKAQGRLRELNLFKNVQVQSIGLKERSKVVHLVVTMVEKQPYYVEIGTGYQTYKGVYVRLKSGDRNFLESGYNVWISGEISAIGYRWDAGIGDSSIFGSQVSADASVFTERREEFNQDFGTETIGGQLTFARPWSKQLTTALGVRYERRQQFLRETTPSSVLIDPETLEPRTLIVTTPTVRYDWRDSFIRPRKGGFASLSADISYGLENSLDNFIKYRLDLRTFISPADRLTLAWRGIGGYIQPYGVEGEIPQDQLFYLGGTGDVRGFEENLLRFDAELNPVGGKLVLASSAEARYDLGRNWEATVFVDGGSVAETLSPGGEDRWRWTAGLGLRYITPIGAVGLLYGYKLDRLDQEDAGRFHLSIGYTF
jgi:outer membrane protein insertion porin family